MFYTHDRVFKTSIIGSQLFCIITIKNLLLDNDSLTKHQEDKLSTREQHHQSVKEQFFV